MIRREFLKRAAASVGAMAVGGLDADDGKPSFYGPTIRDRLWMWGHHPDAVSAGRVYSVWSTTSLTNGFSLLEGDIAADPPVNQYTPTNTVEPAAFYRIRVSLPDE